MRRNWWTLSWTLAFGVMFALTNACFGDDNDTSKSDKSNNAASGQRDNNQRDNNQRDNQNRDQNQNRSDNDDDNATHHAALGVSLTESDGHVTVAAVMPGSPAAKAGLRVGDEIRYVGDERIRTAQGLVDEIAEKRPDTQVDLSIRRNGEKQTLKATLASHDATFGAGDRSRNWAEQQGDNRSNRSDRQANAGRAAYSFGSNDRQAEATRQQMKQHVRAIQQQVSELQQELKTLQASLAESLNQEEAARNQSGANQPQNARQQRSGGQQSYYNGQQGYNNNNGQGRWLDRTGERYSTPRGVSRDHGPRETASGNVADED